MIIQPQIVGQNDYGYELPFTLEDGDGNAVDISLAALTLNVQDSQDPDQAMLFSGSMSVDSELRIPSGSTRESTATVVVYDETQSIRERARSEFRTDTLPTRKNRGVQIK